jgi:hypothetical protein
MPSRRCSRLLADGNGVDEQEVSESGFLERVITGLYIRSVFGAGRDQPHLDTAELLV